jgi:hypothetical protein
MPITFPRAIPDELHIAGLSFVLQPMVEMTPLRSGKQIAADLGPSIWMGEWSTPILTPAQMGTARAWFDSLSSTRDFYAYDIYRQYPLNYAGGFTGGFTGACVLTSATPPYALTLGSLPAGFKLAPGDYLSFDYNSGTSRALHRVSVGGTAAGGALVLEVRPEIRAGFAGGAAVALYRAAARMMIIPNSYSESLSIPDFGTISFKAVQTL